jgi:hypothetical protein
MILNKLSMLMSWKRNQGCALFPSTAREFFQAGDMAVGFVVGKYSAADFLASPHWTSVSYVTCGGTHLGVAQVKRLALTRLCNFIG